MLRKSLTSIIYASAAAACSAFLLGRNLSSDEGRLRLILVWIVCWGIPLLFFFAYPRFVFADSASLELREQKA